MTGDEYSSADSPISSQSLTTPADRQFVLVVRALAQQKNIMLFIKTV